MVWPLKRRVAAVVDGLAGARIEEQRQERAGSDQDDERVEGDLAEQEAPMVGEDVVQQEAHPARGAEAFVDEADRVNGRGSRRAPWSCSLTVLPPGRPDGPRHRTRGA